MPIALIIALLLVGGVGVAAGKAEPNDALYSVKVNVSEKIGSAFSFGAENKAERALLLADRRLEEAESLAAKGELNAEARAEIEAGFKAQAERTQEMIRELEAEGETEAAAKLFADFQTTLLVREAALTKLLSGSATTNTSVEAEGSAGTSNTGRTNATETGAKGSVDSSVDLKVGY